MAEQSNTHSEPGHQGTATALSERVRSLRLPPEVNATRGFGRWSWLPWVFCALFAVTTGALGVSALNRAPPEPAKGVAPPTTLAPSGPGVPQGEVVLESKGYIIAAHQIQVSPKIGGMIIKLDMEEGQRVEKGKILAQLETTDYEAERNRLQAMVETCRERYKELFNGNRPQEIKQAKAELEEAEAVREQTYLDYKRTVALNRQVVAPREYEQIASAYKSADRKVERLKQAYALMVEGAREERILAAKGELSQAEHQLAYAQWKLDNCTIRAPVSGTILTKYAEEGNIVNQLAFNLKGSLCDMADLSDLEVDVKVQERDLRKVEEGQPCVVRPEAFPERTYRGVVSRLMPIADRSQAAVPVRVKITIPPEEVKKPFLKPEMGALVSFYKQ